MAECYFCGADETLTRAHLFQQAFRDAVNMEPGKVSLAGSSIQHPGVYRDILYNVDIRDVNVASLCSPCNSGWMNDIECAAGPVFASIMKGGGFPPPAGLFRLAHWSIVVGALAGETVPKLQIPREHRRVIRFTHTGQPTDYSTHFVWTLDYLPSIEIDIFRFAGIDTEDFVGWCFVLHVGTLVIISATPGVGHRVSKVLHEYQIHSVLGAFSSNIVYAPREVRSASSGVLTPSHARMREVVREILPPAINYLETKGRPVLDLQRAPDRRLADLTFDYGDTLIDARDELDLSYLTRTFG